MTTDSIQKLEVVLRDSSTKQAKLNCREKNGPCIPGHTATVQMIFSNSCRADETKLKFRPVKADNKPIAIQFLTYLCRLCRYFNPHVWCSFLCTHLLSPIHIFLPFHSFFFLCTSLPLPSFMCIILFQSLYPSHSFYICPFSSTFILFLFKIPSYSLSLSLSLSLFRCCISIFATNFKSRFPGIRHLLCRIKKTCACKHRLCCSQNVNLHSAPILRSCYLALEYQFNRVCP